MMKSISPILYMSSSKDGHMGVSAPKNRKKYFAKIGLDPKRLVDIVVTHGNKVKAVTEKDGGKYFEGYDAVITKEKGLTLGLTAADCMPIAFFNPLTNSIGLAHCGWRGLENGIIKNTVKKMGKESVVFIGPHICAKHYRIDLASIALTQLIDAGVSEKNITIDETCTLENKNLFSYRRNQTKDRNLYLLTLSS